MGRFENWKSQDQLRHFYRGEGKASGISFDRSFKKKQLSLGKKFFFGTSPLGVISGVCLKPIPTIIYKEKEEKRARIKKKRNKGKIWKKRKNREKNEKEKQQENQKVEGKLLKIPTEEVTDFSYKSSIF